MEFIPETPKKEAIDVPFYDDVKVEDGWQGHTTSKSIETLRTEIIVCMNRLGGTVMSFVKGSFLIGGKRRDGFQIHYTIETNGIIHQGRLNVAALPVREEFRLNKTIGKRRESSLKMALYMLRKSLEGTWFLQKLSPGYAPLMPWMLNDKGKTITELWSEQVFLENLLPSGEEFVEGVVVE